MTQQHFKAVRPLATHWREATCEEVGCPHYFGGWQTIVPTESPQAQYIREMSERRFEEQRKGDLSRFVFPAGQECFQEHRIQIERDPIFIHEVRDVRKVQEPMEWIEGFNNEMHKLTIPKEV